MLMRIRVHVGESVISEVDIPRRYQPSVIASQPLTSLRCTVTPSPQLAMRCVYVGDRVTMLHTRESPTWEASLLSGKEGVGREIVIRKLAARVQFGS